MKAKDLVPGVFYCVRTYHSEPQKMEFLGTVRPYGTLKAKMRKANGDERTYTLAEILHPWSDEDDAKVARIRKEEQERDDRQKEAELIATMLYGSLGIDHIRTDYRGNVLLPLEAARAVAQKFGWVVDGRQS